MYSFIWVLLKAKLMRPQYVYPPGSKDLIPNLCFIDKSGNSSVAMEVVLSIHQRPVNRTLPLCLISWLSPFPEESQA